MVTKVESYEVLLKSAENEFRSRFKYEPNIVTAAPGRVNLIGEHIDYNHGFVLPMALPMVTIIVGAANKSEATVNLVTLTNNINEKQKEVSFDSKMIAPGSPKWANYIKGVIHHFPAQVKGFDAIVATNVPIGGGLSSSASLEVAIATFLEVLTKVQLAQADKALLCQKAEHTFAMMPCGIMDQMISVMGEHDNALLIDCQNNTASLIPFESDSLAVLIADSNVKHELSSSGYSARREESSKALEYIGWQSYRCCLEDQNDIDEILGRVKDEIQRRRARHVITEIKRTEAAAEALKRNDFVRMGQLMDESHASLDKDFEVSCLETNLLVELTRQCAGVYGSRQTGGGFGGCTVTIIEKDRIPEAIAFVGSNYRKKTGFEASFYIAKPSEGARVVKRSSTS